MDVKIYFISFIVFFFKFVNRQVAVPLNAGGIVVCYLLLQAVFFLVHLQLRKDDDSTTVKTIV